MKSTILLTDPSAPSWPACATIVTSYGDGSTARSHQLVYYSNDQDLKYELGPDGQLERGYSYNAYHQVLTATNALSEVTTYTYDGSRRVSTVQTPAGLLSTYTWGGDGLGSEVVDWGVGGNPIRTNQYTYLKSFVRTHTDPRDLVLTSSWADLQRLTRVDFPDSTYIQHAYTNGSGVLLLDRTFTRDRMGFETRYEYNGVRQLTTVTRANGAQNQVTVYDYCLCGAPNSITEGYGTSSPESTLFSYDLQGNRTNIVYPDTTSFSYKYDSLRRLTNALDALSSTTYWYNNQGLLTAVSNTLGQSPRPFLTSTTSPPASPTPMASR